MLDFKNILCISWYYPPAASGTRVRPVKFIKYLPRFGWKPYVLSVDEKWTGEQDAKLVRDIPPEAVVYRTPFLPIDEPILLKNRIFKKPFSKNRKVLGWLPFTITKGKKICNKVPIQAILAFSSPNTSLLAGVMLKQLTGLPLICNLGDPWTLMEHLPKSNFLNMKLSFMAEKWVFKNADAIIFTTYQTKSDYIRLYSNFLTNKVHVIENGYDPDDYINIVPASRPDGQILITHTGSFFPGRSPEFLLQALAEIREDHPDLSRLITVRFVGSLDDNFVHFCNIKKLKNIVEWCGHKTHDEAIAECMAADVLCLITNDNEKMNTIPGKLYEYFGAKKPILALTPPDKEAGRLIKNANVGWVVSPRDVQGIREILFEILRKYCDTGKINFNTSFTTDPFSRIHRCRELVEVIESVC